MVLKLENILFCDNERPFSPETWEAVSEGDFGQTLGRDSRESVDCFSMTPQSSFHKNQKI